MQKTLENLFRYVSYILVGLLPLMVLPISTNPFTTPKLALMVFGVGILLVLRAIIAILDGKIDFKYSKYDIPLLLLAISYVASTVLRSPNKMEALLLPGVTTAVVAGVLLFYLINQIKGKEKLAVVITISATIYSVVTIFAQLQVFQAFAFLPNYVKSITFTPGGGYLPSAVFLAVVLPLAVSNVIKQKDIKMKVLHGAMSVFVLFALGLSLFQLTPGKPFSPNLPNYNTSWSIAADSVKVSPLLGVGPGNYLSAFNRFRPVEFNATEIWAVKFSTATNFIFTSVTETGLLGLAALVLFAVVFFRSAKEDLKQRKLVGWGQLSVPLMVSLFMFILVFFLLPVTNFLIIFFFMLLGISAKTSAYAINLTLKNAERPSRSSKLPALLIMLPIIGITIYIFYNAATYLHAEYQFRGAVVAVSENRARDGYDKMIRAIQINPQVDRYHIAFSQLNLALANAIAGNATGEDARELTEEERAQIIQLIQQSIQEGKAAVATNPTRSGNWEILGRVYRSIIPLANGADAFALQSFNQASLLDPNNPNLRISVGGVFFGAQDYESAIRAFELAVSAKPDHANARFNLAFALAASGETDAAIVQMTNVLSLVDSDSNDYKVAKQALEALEERKALEAQQAGDNLTPPEEEGEKILQPPAELGEEEAPPEDVVEEEEETEATPTVTASPTPTIIP
ncbi:tetratricopeptide repeat protein [Patescibacteria group bacterium]